MERHAAVGMAGFGGFVRDVQRMLIAALGRLFWRFVIVASALALLMRGQPIDTAFMYAMLILICLKYAVPRVMALAHALHRMRLPGWHSRHAVTLAMAIVLASTPGLILFAQRGDLLFDASAILACASATLAISLLPSGFDFSIVIFLPVMESAGRGPLAESLLGAITVACALLALKRWKKVLRMEPPAMGRVSPWDAHDGMLIWSMPGSGVVPARGGVVDGLLHLRPRWRHAHAHAATPRSPRRRMAQLLGDPFTPRPWWMHALQWAWGLALMALMVFAAHHKHWAGTAQAIVLGLVALAVLMSVLRGHLRLVALAPPASADRAELALMPGFGDVEKARAMLLRVVFWPALGRALAVALLGLAACALAGAPRRLLALLAVWGVLALLAGSATLIGVYLAPAGRFISRQRHQFNMWVGLAAFIAIAVASADALAAANPASGKDAWALLATLGAASIVLLARTLVRGWRRFQQHPHPFLQR